MTFPNKLVVTNLKHGNVIADLTFKTEEEFMSNFERIMVGTTSDYRFKALNAIATDGHYKHRDAYKQFKFYTEKSRPTFPNRLVMRGVMAEQTIHIMDKDKVAYLIMDILDAPESTERELRKMILIARDAINTDSTRFVLSYGPNSYSFFYIDEEEEARKKKESDARAARDQALNEFLSKQIVGIVTSQEFKELMG